jgi:uncharacterized RDD family membrane protein YckC
MDATFAARSSTLPRVRYGMERVFDVPTAEAVALRYELAGIGSRFLAVALDLALQSVAAAVIVIAVALTAWPTVVVATRMGFRDPVSAIVLAALVIAVFAIFFGYFIYFEVAWNGRTPGKRALGLRVMRTGGFPVDAQASVVRNVVRILEAGVGLYALSGLVVLRSERNQRIGDYAAGTVVVVDRPADDSILDAIAAVDDGRDDGCSPADRELIARFLARRDDLDVNARAIIATKIATRVRPKLAASFAHLDDEALLEHLGRP